MKRIRRNKFKEMCACWFLSDGEWIRSPAAMERFHLSDRYDPKIGPCVLGCADKPCLTQCEREEVKRKQEEFVRNAIRTRKLKRIYSPV